MTPLEQTLVGEDIRTLFDTTPTDPVAMCGILPAVIRLLGEGHPVSRAEIADAANLPLARRSVIADFGSTP